jgi:hypothetical protein
MIDDTIARVKDLIKQREEIDAELAGIFGVSDQPRRGRPRKAAANGGGESSRPVGMSVPSTPSGEGEPPAG